MSLLQDRLDPTFVIKILDFGRVAGRKAKIKLTCSSRLSEGTGIPQLMVLCRGVKKHLKIYWINRCLVSTSASRYQHEYSA